MTSSRPGQRWDLRRPEPGTELRPRPYVIGLTGNIAAGKSSVARMLGELGAELIDADQVTHELMAAKSAVWQAIVQAFGEGILSAGGEIDRQKLGGIVFADAAALRWLEQIVHPAVIAEVNRRIAALSERGDRPVIVVEAVKLIESGMHKNYDALWVVICAPEQQKTRLMARNKSLSEAEAVSRLAAQPPVSEKIGLADVVIDNSGSLAATRAQVERAWQTLMHLDKKV
jgi:dephospho-CoA kinase